MIKSEAIKEICIFLTFIAFNIFIFAFSPKQGGFWWSDASRHAMDGAFFYDFFSDFPLTYPIKYAIDFYLKYPAISIGFYPPLFAVFESWIFFLWGPSHFSAQLTVAIFYFIMMAGAYKLALQWMPRLQSVSFVLLFAGAQQITFWGRQVMLEIPAYAFLLWSAHYFLRFLKTDKYILLFISITLYILGCYTKLNLIFIAPVFLLNLFHNADASVLRQWKVTFALTWGVFLLLPLIFITIEFGQTNLGAVVGGQARDEIYRYSFNNWLYYIKCIPNQLGVVNMFLVCVSVLILPKTINELRSNRIVMRFFGVWFVWGYLFFSIVALKEARHTIFLIFPILFITMLIINRIFSGNRFGYAILLLAILNIVGTIYFYPVPYIRNHAAAADYTAAHLPKGYRVMIHSYWDGNFIFNLWCHRNRKDLQIIRSDKYLLDMAVKRSMGFEENDLTETQILDILNDYGVYFVVCEHGFWDDLKTMKRFENILKSRFEKVYQGKLDTNVPKAVNKKMTIYRNPEVGAGPFEAIQYDLRIISAKIRDGKLEQQ